jgi:hypothetical protein
MIFSGFSAALSAYLLWGFAHNLWVIFAFVVVFGGLVILLDFCVHVEALILLFGTERGLRVNLPCCLYRYRWYVFLQRT